VVKYGDSIDDEPQLDTRLGVTSQSPLFSIRIVTMYWKGALLDRVALSGCCPDVWKPMVCEATKTAIRRTSLMILILRLFPVFIAHPVLNPVSGDLREGKMKTEVERRS